MQTPIKIDDRLKDAIVSVKFDSDLPEQLVTGVFYSVFFNKIKQVKVETPFEAFKALFGEAEISTPDVSYFTTLDGAIRIDVLGREIAFNITGKYPRWAVYSVILEEFLKPLFDTNIITRVKRLGLRYISQFNALDIFDNINGTVDLDLPYSVGHSVFRTEVEHEESLCIISITSDRRVDTNQGQGVSLIDLDVIQDYDLLKVEIFSYLVLKERIEHCHTFGKSIFFELLKTSFVKTLNPEY